MRAEVAAGEWDGCCACGKAEMDGTPCKLGATHTTRAMLLFQSPITAVASSLPWTTTALPSNGKATIFPWSTPMTAVK